MFRFDLRCALKDEELRCNHFTCVTITKWCPKLSRSKFRKMQHNLNLKFIIKANTALAFQQRQYYWRGRKNYDENNVFKLTRF